MSRFKGDMRVSGLLFVITLLLSVITYYTIGSKYIPIIVSILIIVNLLIVIYFIKQSITDLSKIKITNQTMNRILSEQKHDFSVIISVSGIIFGFSSLILMTIFPEEIDKSMNARSSMSYICIFIGTIYSIGSIAICLFDLFVRSSGIPFDYQSRKIIKRIVTLQYINRNATLWALFALTITLVGLVGYFTQGFEILRFISDPITDGTIDWSGN